MAEWGGGHFGLIFVALDYSTVQIRMSSAADPMAPLIN